MHDPAFDGESGGAGAVVGSEFVEDLADIELHQRFTHVEAAGDFLVGASIDDVAQDGGFAFSERFAFAASPEFGG
jgi:hypothetical protein